MADYILGYGSLMSKASRTGTDPGAVGAWPAEVTGYLRGWFHKFSNSSSISPTFLGVVPMKDQRLNGIIYKTEDINATDRRENGYARAEITGLSTVTWYGPSLTLKQDDRLWIYVSKTGFRDNRGPDEGNPIVQSYVDICMIGCFEADEQANKLQSGPAFRSPFAEQFIATTSHWGYWVNDRTTPRRPWTDQPQAGKIDTILKAQEASQKAYQAIKADTLKPGSSADAFVDQITAFTKS